MARTFGSSPQVGLNFTGSTPQTTPLEKWLTFPSPQFQLQRQTFPKHLIKSKQLVFRI
jgi:hypothetical protein